LIAAASLKVEVAEDEVLGPIVGGGREKSPD